MSMPNMPSMRPMPATLLSAASPSPSSTAASTQGEAALADRLAKLREQAEQLVRELDEMQKEVQKK